MTVTEQNHSHSPPNKITHGITSAARRAQQYINQSLSQPCLERFLFAWAASTGDPDVTSHTRLVISTRRPSPSSAGSLGPLACGDEGDGVRSADCTGEGVRSSSSEDWTDLGRCPVVHGLESSLLEPPVFCKEPVEERGVRKGDLYGHLLIPSLRHNFLIVVALRPWKQGKVNVRLQDNQFAICIRRLGQGNMARVGAAGMMAMGPHKFLRRDGEGVLKQGLEDLWCHDDRLPLGPV